MITESQVENQVERRAADGEVPRATPALGAPHAMDWWMRAALALLFALYIRAVGFAPVYDDNLIGDWSGSWRDVPKFFAHDIFSSGGQAHSVYYRPLAMTWGFLLSSVTGGAPGWLHLGAIFLHLAVVVLAYIFGRKLLGDERLALLTALLFGLHPSKVESVAWIGSSCVDGLGGVLFFASLIAFLNWREKSREASSRELNSRETQRKRAALRSGPVSAKRLWLAASVALFAAALFTKETMVCIPMLIAAYLWLVPGAAAESVTNVAPGAPELTIAGGRAPLGIRLRKLAVLLPYAAVWAFYMAIRHQVIKPAPAAADYIHPTFTLSNVWTAPFAIWWYLRHLAMPWGLSVEYTPVVLEHPTLTGFVLPAAGLIVLLLAAWALWRRQRSALAAFLGFWFVLNLAPPVIVAPMVLQHDRYLYLSAYAFCALLAWAILRLGRLPARARLAIALSVVAFWSALTWHEMGYWDSDATLWARVLQVSPSSIKAQIQMAFLYREAGDVRHALAVLDDGLRYRPDSPSIWLARADILAGEKQWDEARAAYRNVMRVTEPAPGQVAPAGPLAKMRAAAAYQLALLDLSARNFSEGEQYARTAIGLRYDGVGYHCALAANLRGEGWKDEAKAEDAIELRLRLEQQRRNASAER